jgi:hypothetical protein
MPRQTLADKIRSRLTDKERAWLHDWEKQNQRAMSSSELREKFGTVNKEGQFKRAQVK